jgi:CRISPR-associated protein Cmr3
MPEQIVTVRGIDSLLFGDGRPFHQEEGAQTARTQTLPPPGTLAGFLRTQWGEAQEGWQWNAETITRAKQVACAGPLLLRDQTLLFPLPSDAVIYCDKERTPRIMPLAPFSPEESEGVDLPEGLLPLEVTEDVKPEPGYHFCPGAWLMEWLVAPSAHLNPPEKIEGPPREERIHVGMDATTGCSKDAMLYSVQYVGFTQRVAAKGEASEPRRNHQWELLAKVKSDPAFPRRRTGTFGGERRLAALECVSDSLWQTCPNELQATLNKACCLRLVLATPALFSGGWKPGWLDEQFVGAPPGIGGTRLKLIGAAVRRREAVSGWDYETCKPKAVRWLAPAGSVYFFEVVKGDALALAEATWLQSVSDEEQDQRDGYGLALWGTWNRNKERAKCRRQCGFICTP